MSKATVISADHVKWLVKEAIQQFDGTDYPVEQQAVIEVIKAFGEQLYPEFSQAWFTYIVDDARLMFEPT